jgi:hypothetical protein
MYGFSLEVVFTEVIPSFLHPMKKKLKSKMPKTMTG